MTKDMTLKAHLRNKFLIQRFGQDSVSFLVLAITKKSDHSISLENICAKTSSCVAAVVSDRRIDGHLNLVDSSHQNWRGSSGSSSSRFILYSGADIITSGTWFCPPPLSISPFVIRLFVLIINLSSILF